MDGFQGAERVNWLDESRVGRGRDQTQAMEGTQRPHLDRGATPTSAAPGVSSRGVP